MVCLDASGPKGDHLGAAGTVDLVGVTAPTTQAAVGRPEEPVTVQAARGPTGSKQQLGSGLRSLAKAKLARPVQLPAPYQERALPRRVSSSGFASERLRAVPALSPELALSDQGQSFGQLVE